MELLKIFLITAMVSGCAHTFSEGALDSKPETELESIPEFESLVGSGMLETTGTGVTTEKTKAWITVSDNEIIPGRENCETLMLNSKDELVVKIAHCAESQEYIMCGGNDSECVIDFETKESKNSLSLINDYSSDEIRHVVEFHKGTIIYRIQMESCLIPYPHGCIIDGFSWIDLDIYTFTKN